MNDKEEYFHCPKCDGRVTIIENQNIGTCEDCDTLVPLPIVVQKLVLQPDDAKIQNAVAKLNKAAYYSQSYQFHRAFNAYDKLAKAFGNNGDIDFYPYWGKVLAQYGIVYQLNDHLENQVVCLRTSFDSVFENENYLKAMQYADLNTQVILKKEATQIDMLLKESHQALLNFEPIDVIICVDDAKSNPNHDEDCEKAEQIKKQLEELNYKVLVTKGFFERNELLSLENKIFPALETANAMVVISKDCEHFNNNLFRNIWTRFYRHEAIVNNLKQRFMILMDLEENIELDVDKTLIYEFSAINSLPRLIKQLQNNLEILKEEDNKQKLTCNRDAILHQILSEGKFEEVKNAINEAIDNKQMDYYRWWIAFLAKNNAKSNEEILLKQIDPREDYYFCKAYFEAPRSVKRLYYHYLEELVVKFSKLEEVNEEYEKAVSNCQKQYCNHRIWKLIKQLIFIAFFTAFCFITISLGNFLSFLVAFFGTIILYSLVICQYYRTLYRDKLPPTVKNEVEVKKYYKRIRDALAPEQAAPLLPNQYKKKYKITGIILMAICGVLSLSYFVKETVVRIQNNDLNYYYYFDSVVITGGSSMETIHIPSTIDGRTVKEIAHNAFMNDDVVNTLEVDEGLEIINDSAFKNCNNLEFVYLPTTFRKVGEEAPFEECDKLKDNNVHYQRSTTNIKWSNLVGITE